MHAPHPHTPHTQHTQTTHTQPRSAHAAHTLRKIRASAPITHALRNTTHSHALQRASHTIQDCLKRIHIHNYLPLLLKKNKFQKVYIEEIFTIQMSKNMEYI